MSFNWNFRWREHWSIHPRKRPSIRLKSEWTVRTILKHCNGPSCNTSTHELTFIYRQPGDGLTPPHFYGELTKTEEGCNLLRERGHFKLFADYVRNFSLKKQDQVEASLGQLKAVLWALGNIGATKNGLPFLEEEDVVKDIVEMAESSDILSLKG